MTKTDAKRLKEREDLRKAQEKFRVGTIVRIAKWKNTSNSYKLNNIEELEITKTAYKPNYWTKLSVEVKITKGHAFTRAWNFNSAKNNQKIILFVDCLEVIGMRQPVWDLY